MSTSAQMMVHHDNNSISFHVTNLDNQRISKEIITPFLLRHFNLDKNHNFNIVRISADKAGYAHYRLDHTVSGHRVIGSDVICHVHNGVVSSINGRLRIPEIIQSQPILETIALGKAKKYTEATSFKWEFPEEEAMLKIWKEDTSATYYPSGELVYVPKDFDFKSALTLCYQFELNSESPLLRKNIFIHAETGHVWAEENLLHDVDVKGSANTKYRGVKPITTDSSGPGKYRLRETGRGNGIETYDMNKGTNYGAAVDFTDSDNYWNNYNTNFDEIGGDAHFGAEMTYDFYKQYFNRNSFDGNGAKIRSYVHYRSNYVNAFWNGSVMTYGDGNGSSYTPLTSLDICGHEITHAVTSRSAGLIYRNESGALNESFSDIFGNAIEYYADSTQFSWRMGEDIMASASGLRNMANPKTHRDPSTYKGTYWYGGTGDNGGVHTNSGVQNFWFFVLTTGASGTNDNGDNYTVDSLGIKKAQQIAYRNLTVYLTSSSDYDEARYYAIQSATDLYGDCSQEVQATTNAWYAVGVGDAYDSSVVIAEFDADSTYCDASETVQFLNKSVNAKNYLWDFGDGDTSTQQNPAHVYPSQGDYTVTLIAESCFSNNFDTIEKKDFISIDSNQDICNGYLLPKGSWSTIHACNGFIYDHNGESDYQGLLKDTLTIDFGRTDSAQITFQEMDYENAYDSIYVYDGPNTSSTLIGGFTGKNLPFGGKAKTLYNGAVTIRHFSDPFVVGTGFKVKFETFKEPLQLFKPGNRNVCYNEQVTLTALGRGGDVADHAYFWNGKKGGKSITFKATTDTLIYITFGDECMQEYLYDSVRVTVRPAITFIQSNDTTICQGTGTTLSVDPEGGKNTFDFEVSDGTTGKGNSFSYNTANLTPGVHAIWIRFTDNCTYPEDTAFFTVTVRDSLSISTSVDTTICYGTSAFLKAFGVGGLSNQYKFDWGGGTFSTSTQTANPNKDSTYSVTLSDGCSQFTPTASIAVKVLDSLSVTILGQDTACFGESITLNSSVTGGATSQYQYLWKPSNNTSDTETDVIRSTTTFQLEVTDGCTPKNGISEHTVGSRPALSLVTSNDTILCFGETAMMSVAHSGGINAQHQVTWSHGLGNGDAKTIIPLFTRTYIITLKDNCSDTVSNSITVTVNPNPIIDFSASSVETCTGLPVQFTDLSFSAPPSTYRWSLGDGNSRSDRNPENTYTQKGEYDIFLHVTNGFGCIDSLNRVAYVTVVDHPIADFSFSPVDPSFLNNIVNFQNTSKFYSTSSWDFGNGSTSTENNPSQGFGDTGSYSVLLRVENDFGCYDEAVKSIYVADDVILYVPTAISPNNDVVNDVFTPYVRGMKQYDVMVYNRWGEVLWKSTESEKSWNGQANGKLVKLGFYFYRFTGVDMNGNNIEDNGMIHVLY
ncbi:MAG: gliding motility-associated-like protein [bacterium]